MCFKCGLYWQGLTHDLSKYSPTEFFSSVKYYNGNHSPIDDEIKELGYSKCWLHHMAHNKHHWSYWVDVEHSIKADMPYEYIVEMFCDRVAASKIYLKDKYTDSSAYDYLMSSKCDESSKYMSERTYNSLKMHLIQLKELGEDEVCSFIKWRLKELRKERMGEDETYPFLKWRLKKLRKKRRRKK